jgi:aminopeptidase
MDDIVVSKQSHQQRLERLAEIAVQVGLCLAPGQELLISAPIEALPLVQRITERAYKAGASLVTALFGDDASTLLRFKHASDESFDKASWLYDAMATALSKGAAWLLIAGDDPALLAGQDPDKVARADRARWPALQHILNFNVNWSIVSYATPAWAKAVFPKDAEEVAVSKLWDAIFAASRVDTADPIAAWHAHNEALLARSNFLNDKRFAALHFRGPCTDLRVGLADDHQWVGGAWTANNGISFNPNIPCEEVGTAPHKDRVEGVVRSTKPLSYQGTLIEGITVRFTGGRIVEANADKGRDVLRKVLETDEGARHLGEVALVPVSSPIAKGGLLFYNTLYDENAASHIAIGQAYSICFVNGRALAPAELDAKGGNRSLIHIDWMIGSPTVDVDGVASDGTATPLMRAGEWAFPDQRG